jgi:hypothetical protein
MDSMAAAWNRREGIQTSQHRGVLPAGPGSSPAGSSTRYFTMKAVTNTVQAIAELEQLQCELLAVCEEALK